MYLMNDQDFRAAANAPLERCQVCFEQGSRAHYCDETGCRQPTFSRSVGLGLRTTLRGRERPQPRSVAETLSAMGVSLRQTDRLLARRMGRDA